MFAHGEDHTGFFIVIDPGQGSPLEIFRRARNQPDAVTQPRLPRNRRLIWANGLRIAQALDLLHSQGIIHRNIDPWAIVTCFAEEPDFRLTGFEWSMRIASVDGPGQLVGRKPDEVASFRQDWINFGLLLAELLSAPAERVANLAVLASEVAEHVTAAEARILRAMLGLDNADRLDGGLICRQIEDVLDGIEAQVRDKEMKWVLSVRLGQGSDISTAIRRASNNEIEMGDIAGQLRFVVDDLSEEPLLAKVSEHGRAERPVLMGRQLTYSLTQYRQPKSTEQATWEFAVCERAHVGRPYSMSANVPIRPETLDILDGLEATKRFPRRRSRVARWDDLIRSLEPRERTKSDLERKHQAFALLSVLEMAYAAANIFPVDVLPGSSDRSSDMHVLRLSPRHDAERAALSKALKLDAPTIRLSKMLENDELPDDEGWALSEGGSLGERKSETEWRNVKSSEDGAAKVLQFEGAVATKIHGPALLAPAGMSGQIAQFRRRVKALKALREHTELLRMFVDPRGRIDDSRDPVVEDERFRKLDASKRLALTEILSTVPLFLLQGPPGVGKTFMVGDLVRRRFEDEPTTRLLLSAQSNPAIDHLMKEVQTVFPEGAEPVMVRARPADDDPADTDLEIDRQADKLLEALDGSDLVKEASPHIADKVHALAQSRRKQSRRGAKSPRSAEARAFESMILRAANVVFATTNSAAVEQLIEEKGLFDWTIVEEAGKATGPELLSPLLLSHRRLMIGDHKQLPPYGADTMSRLLADANSVRAAVRASEALIARHLKDPGMEEVFDEVESEDTDYGRLCSDALETLTLFETLVEGEFSWQLGHRNHRPIARKLTEQHRMHPAIAKIVSDCFYDGLLKTNPEKTEEYRKGVPPFGSADPRALPETPLVFVDMPYVREQHGYRGGDRAPAWSNPDEVGAVLQILKLLKSNAVVKQPSLAVLSPYNER
jgi:AAA domain